MNKQLQVVIVDDDSFMVEMLTEMLNSLDVERVVGFTEAQSALAAFADTLGAADLIILDILMPDMDGIEFVRELGGRGYKGHVLLLSGAVAHLRSATTRLGKLYGVNVVGSLTKPLALVDLRGVLETLPA